MSTSPPPPPPPPPEGQGGAPPTARRKSYWSTPAGIASIVVVIGALLLIAVKVGGAVSGNGAATDRCQDAIRAETSAGVEFIGRPSMVRAGEKYGVSGQVTWWESGVGRASGSYHCWVQRDGWNRWTMVSATVARSS